MHTPHQTPVATSQNLAQMRREPGTFMLVRMAPRPTTPALTTPGEAAGTDSNKSYVGIPIILLQYAPSIQG